MNPVELVQTAAEARRAGAPDRAAAAYRSALAEAPKMIAAMTGLGQVLLDMGEAADALRVFRDAHTLMPSHPELLTGLADCCAALGMQDQAKVFLEEAHLRDPWDGGLVCALARSRRDAGDLNGAVRLLEGWQRQPQCGVLNLLAEYRQQNGDLAGAADAWRESLQIDGSQDHVRNAVTSLQGEDTDAWRKVFHRILVLAVQRNFVEDLAESWGESADVRFCDGRDKNEMYQLLQWCDVVWSDWCDGLLVEASAMPGRSPVITRLHRYEAFTDFPCHVQWNRVRHIVFVADSVVRTFRARFRASAPAAFQIPYSVVHNGVRFDRFPLNPEKTYGARFAYAGFLKAVKNPPLLLQCFHALHACNPAATFHVAGYHQDPVIELYWQDMVKKLELPVQVDGWVKDMPGWLADKDYILSTSVIESFQYSVAEAMAAGLLPLVHNWKNAGVFYPRRAIFNTPADCVRIYRGYEQSDRRRLAADHRRWLERRFSFERQRDGIDRVLNAVAAEAR